MKKLYLNGEGFVHFDDVSFIIFDKNKVDFEDMPVVLLGCI